MTHTTSDVYLVRVPMLHAASMGAIVGMPTTGGKLVTVPVSRRA